jgi:hypothetical protein
MNLSRKAAPIASILLRLSSYLSGIMTSTSTTPKTRPQIAPRMILFIVLLCQPSTSAASPFGSASCASLRHLLAGEGGWIHGGRDRVQGADRISKDAGPTDATPAPDIRQSAFGTRHSTERVGFEPTVPLGTHAFQTCPFGRSGTSPRIRIPGVKESRSPGSCTRILGSLNPRFLHRPAYPMLPGCQTCGYLIRTSIPGLTASTMVLSGIESSSM